MDERWKECGDKGKDSEISPTQREGEEERTGRTETAKLEKGEGEERRQQRKRHERIDQQHPKLLHISYNYG